MVSQPLISIVTPVFNGEKYLEECIESVLRQSYKHWEYLIVDNASTDSTLVIARRYAEHDDRIRICHYDEFVSVIESHNRALRLIAAQSKYCKLLPADDWMYPECIERMVECAELNPSVGVVGGYALSGNKTSSHLKFDGLPYEKKVVRGHDVCRWHLLGGDDYLGMPSSVLYRSNLIRQREQFYPNLRQHADISAFYECLCTTDLGFVHQVLMFERIHPEALSATARKFSSYTGSQLLDLQKYGPMFLTEDELETRYAALLEKYYDVLAGGVINRWNETFWSYHRKILKEAGLPLYGTGLARAIGCRLADLLLNPKQTFERVRRRLKSQVESKPEHMHHEVETKTASA